MQLSLFLILFGSAPPARAALTGQSASAASAALLPQALSKSTACLGAAVQKSEPVCGVLGLGSNTCHLQAGEAAPLAQLISGPQNKDFFSFSLNLLSAHFQLHAYNTTNNVLFFFFLLQ